MSLNRDLKLLKPEFRLIVEFILLRAKELGTNLVVNETLRTQAVQEAYYAQGRQPLAAVNELRKKAGLYLLDERENGRIVTYVRNIDTTKSHGGGLAVDVVPDGKWNAPKEKWDIIGKCIDEARVEYADHLKAHNASLIWGAQWKSLNDTPHIEMIKNK